MARTKEIDSFGESDGGHEEEDLSAYEAPPQGNIGNQLPPMGMPSPPAEIVATGPWFVLTPCGVSGSACASDNPEDQQQWHTERVEGDEQAAIEKAAGYIRRGMPYAYVVRALHKLEMPVHCSTLLERKPAPVEKEEE